MSFSWPCLERVNGNIARKMRPLFPDPTTMFCCGCPLAGVPIFGVPICRGVPICESVCSAPICGGVPTIMGFHLLACLTYVALSFSRVVLHSSIHSSSNTLQEEMWLTGMYLCGIPIIAAGLYGAFKRIEVNVRIYWWYLLLCLTIDTFFLVEMFMWEDPCRTTGSFTKVLGEDYGTAFVCGFTRIWSYAFAIAAISMEIYCLYIVWSFCEVLRTMVNCELLGSLAMSSKDEAWMLKHSHGAISKHDDGHIGGLAHHKIQGPYPSPHGLEWHGIPIYGATQKLPTPTYNIFGGSEHDTNFPPMSRHDEVNHNMN